MKITNRVISGPTHLHLLGVWFVFRDKRSVKGILMGSCSPACSSYSPPSGGGVQRWVWAFWALQMKLHNSWKVLFSGGVEKLIDTPWACSYFKTCSIRGEVFSLSDTNSRQPPPSHSDCSFPLWRLNIPNCSGGNVSKSFQGLQKIK